MREDSNMNSNIEHNCDVLVIGSGAAGLSLALCLASKAKVIVLSKSGLSAGSTNYAQGGIAGVFNTADDNDSVEEHIEDTKIAGGGLCDPDAVEFTLRNAHDSIEWLIQQGVPFDQKEEAVSEDQSPYHLHREGGHSHRRIFHAADHTVRCTIRQFSFPFPQEYRLQQLFRMDQPCNEKDWLFPV